MTRSRPLCGLGLVAIALVAGLTTSGTSRAAETSLAIEVQDLFQIPVDQRRRLLRGDIVSYSVTENSEREIAVGLAMMVSTPVGQIAQYLASGQLVAQDSSISESAPVPAELASGSVVGPGAAEIALDTYRRLLSLRVQSYRQAGLAGIAPYARAGGASTDPAVDLRLAVGDVERIGPATAVFREALQRYLADQPPQLTNQVYWVKRRMQRRPHLSLLHRMVATGEGPTIHLERYFYVGHSYNSMHTITGAFAFEGGTMLDSTTRVSTDEILGVGSQLKRTVGRGQVRDEMRTRLERLRAAFNRPVAPESP